jgi:hypothetical protein
MKASQEVLASRSPAPVTYAEKKKFVYLDCETVWKDIWKNEALILSVKLQYKEIKIK